MYYVDISTKENDLTPVDKQNFEDVLVIAYQLLTESKMYDFTVINPINFYAIVMMEYGYSQNPQNRDFQLILIKLYNKLGCTSLVKNICNSF